MSSKTVSLSEQSDKSPEVFRILGFVQDETFNAASEPKEKRSLLVNTSMTNNQEDQTVLQENGTIENSMSEEKFTSFSVQLHSELEADLSENDNFYSETGQTLTDFGELSLDNDFHENLKKFHADIIAAHNSAEKSPLDSDFPVSQNCVEDDGDQAFFVQNTGEEIRLKTSPSRRTHDKLPPEKVCYFSELPQDSKSASNDKNTPSSCSTLSCLQTRSPSSTESETSIEPPPEKVSIFSATLESENQLSSSNHSDQHNSVTVHSVEIRKSTDLINPQTQLENILDLNSKNTPREVCLQAINSVHHDGTSITRSSDKPPADLMLCKARGCSFTATIFQEKFPPDKMKSEVLTLVEHPVPTSEAPVSQFHDEHLVEVAHDSREDSSEPSRGKPLTSPVSTGDKVPPDKMRVLGMTVFKNNQKQIGDKNLVKMGNDRDRHSRELIREEAIFYPILSTDKVPPDKIDDLSYSCESEMKPSFHPDTTLYCGVSIGELHSTNVRRVWVRNLPTTLAQTCSPEAFHIRQSPRTNKLKPMIVHHNVKNISADFTFHRPIT